MCLLQNHDIIPVEAKYIWNFGSCVETKQGFMQDKIIASHTCFGGHMDVNC